MTNKQSESDVTGEATPRPWRVIADEGFYATTGAKSLWSIEGKNSMTLAVLIGAHHL
jgi:hypothetical protein